MRRSLWRVSRVAVVALLLFASACSSTTGPRQADRTPSADPYIPAVDEPGTTVVAETGVVTEQFRASGSVQASDAVAVVVPYSAVITSRPPDVGTEINEGDILFSFAPSQAARAVAAEYEASAYARIHGTGDSADREARYQEARARAEAMGIPVDDPSALPLPDESHGLSPLTGIVLRSTNTGASQVAGGTVVVEVGRGEGLFVAGSVTEPIAQILGIGSTVKVSADDVEGDAFVDRIDFPEGSPQIVTLLIDSEIAADSEIEIDHGDDRPPERGVVIEASGDDDAGWTVLAEVADPKSGFRDSVEIAPRRDLDNIVIGRLDSVAVVSSLESVMTISIPEGSLAFDASVRITLFGETRSEVLWLPPDAIRNYEGIDYVIVEHDGERSRVDVEIGLRSDDRIEIVGDLSEGDTVVVP